MRSFRSVSYGAPTPWITGRKRILDGDSIPVTWAKISPAPFRSLSIRFVAYDSNMMTSPKAETATLGTLNCVWLPLLPCVPLLWRETRTVLPVDRSWKNMSTASFSSSSTRLEAHDSKTTNRPSPEMALLLDHESAIVPSEDGKPAWFLPSSDRGRRYPRRRSNPDRLNWWRTIERTRTARRPKYWIKQMRCRPVFRPYDDKFAISLLFVCLKQRHHYP